MLVDDLDFGERLQALAAQTERLRVLAEIAHSTRQRDRDDEVAELQRRARVLALETLISILHQAAI